MNDHEFLERLVNDARNLLLDAEAEYSAAKENLALQNEIADGVFSLRSALRKFELALALERGEEIIQ